MKLLPFICFALLTVAAAKEAHGCEPINVQTIEVHVVWRFANSDFNKLWIADALAPRIDAPDFYIYPPAKQVQAGNSFDVTFCLVTDRREATLGRLTFSLGDDQLTLRARPIQWTSVPSENDYYEAKTTTRYGRMTEIVVPPRPDLKTLIFGNATLTHNEHGQARLKFDCFNPTAIAHPGVRLKLTGREHIQCEVGPGGYIEPKPMIIPIRIRFGKNGVDIFGGDPAFPGELFKRRMTFKEASCMGAAGVVALELGASGPLAPGLGVIRYAFDMDGRPVGKDGRAIAEAVEWKSVEEMELEITVEGSNVYPDSIPILPK